MRYSPISLKTFSYAWLPALFNWLILAIEYPLINFVFLHNHVDLYYIIYFNIAYAFLYFVEAPIIMLNMLSITFIENYYDYLKVLKTAYGIMLTTTIIYIFFLFLPAVTTVVSQNSSAVASDFTRIRNLCLIAVVIAFFIGHKRIFQGILFASGAYNKIVLISLLRVFATLLCIWGGVRYFSSIIAPDYICMCLLSGVIMLEALLTHLFSKNNIQNLAKSMRNSTLSSCYMTGKKKLTKSLQIG